MNLTPKQTIKGTVAEALGLNGSVKDSRSVKGSVAETQSLRGSMKDIPSLDNTLTKEGYAADAKAVGEALDSKAPISHTEDKGNPHGVTASQVGARPDTWMPSASEIGARPDTWMPTASDVGARANTWTPTAQEVGARPDNWMPTADDVGAVPISRTVNGKSLGGDISLTASDVGARENTWMPSASDVGARPNTWTPSAQEVGARPDTWMPTAEDVGAAPTNHKHEGETIHPSNVELTGNSGHGGYIDFHFNGESKDHTSRIIESANGILQVYGTLKLENGLIGVEAKDVGADHSTLLWQNASPTSQFVNQTITLPSNNFPFFRVLFGETSGMFNADITFPVGKTVLVSCNSGQESPHSGIGLNQNRRITATTQTSITFETGYYFDITNHIWSTYNGVLIPMYVYGVGGLD